MFSMLPYPPYKIGWVIHERTIDYTSKGKPRKKPITKYYASVFLNNGFGGDTPLFKSYDECDNFAKEVFEGEHSIYYSLH